LQIKRHRDKTRRDETTTPRPRTTIKTKDEKKDKMTRQEHTIAQDCRPSFPICL
jgi:hypothetical protein